MILYKAVIHPVSSYLSPLQSDTLFGAFCWSYRYIFGEEQLNHLLEQYKDGKPEIIFSNAFPIGYLPFPFGFLLKQHESDIELDKSEKYQEYILYKQLKKITMIKKEEFNHLINGEIEQLKVEQEDYILHQEERVRNMVSRYTDTVENIDGSGSLYETEQCFTDTMFDLYILSSLQVEHIKRVLELMFTLGIGAQRSVGKGVFEVISLNECCDFKFPEKPDAFITLSNFVPDADNPTHGYYKTLAKYPKLSHVEHENDSPFKKPLLFLTAGSMFADQTIRQYYGSCIKHVTMNQDKNADQVVIGAYTIAIPMIRNGW